MVPAWFSSFGCCDIHGQNVVVIYMAIIYNYVYIYRDDIYIYIDTVDIPVVPQKAVAEVSKIGHL